ncbi:hypothetical protein GCM10027449_20680 [Sinomonas notoginsengisoli]|uniref:hypothetical protein n=1 Tax=Sinomonas notoginsengisoli TaxID=1457311 RepID=UPI001F266269|nr:hypothetical protein [Sinomonas notoginsengisoli]
MSEFLPRGTSQPQQSGTSATVKDEARGVAGDAASSAQAVGGVAKDEAANVAGETKSQISDLMAQSRDEVKDQAAHQQARAAEGLRAIHRQLHSMASNSEEQGVGTDLVRRAASRTGAFAEWLDQRDPGSVLQEVKSYARRRPGMFLAIAAGAGLLAGRLSRSLAAGQDDRTQGAIPPRPANEPSSTPTPYTAGAGYSADASERLGTGVPQANPAAGTVPPGTVPGGTAGAGFAGPGGTAGTVGTGGTHESRPAVENTDLEGILGADGSRPSHVREDESGLTGQSAVPPLDEKWEGRR